MNRHASPLTTFPLIAVVTILFLSFSTQTSYAQGTGRQDHLQIFRQSVDSTKKAFTGVVANPRRGTVQLLADGKPVALGTLMTADGLLVTKASQASRANRAKLFDGREFELISVGMDQSHDIAVYRIPARNLPALNWSEKVPDVGAWMASAGIGEEPVSMGVLSVGRRSIPSNGDHGVLGIELERDEVARIRRVYPNSGAESAGLESGDVVLQVDQRDITTGAQLVRAIRRYRPGDTVVLKIRRQESDVDYPVTLTHPFGGFLSRIAFQNQMGGELSFRRDDFEAAYQTDTVLAPEECGGPVVDLDGNVIGINIARAGRTETYVLPADLVLSTFQQIQASAAGSQSVVTRKTPAPPVEGLKEH